MQCYYSMFRRERISMWFRR